MNEGPTNALRPTSLNAPARRQAELRPVVGVEEPHEARRLVVERAAEAFAAAAVGGRLHHVRQRVRARVDRERPAALPREASGEFPAADDLVHDGVDVAANRLAPAERQLDEEVRVEHVRAVEVRPRVVEAAVEDVERRARRRLVVGAGDHGERGIVRARVLRLRQRVAHHVVVPVGVPPFELQLQAVVARPVARVDHVHAREVLRVREEEVGPEPGELRQRLRALDALSERGGERGDDCWSSGWPGTGAAPCRSRSRRPAAACRATSNWFMSGLWPPALTMLNASRKPFLKISAWLTL